MNNYTTEPTRCRCHRETCDCLPWTVTKNDNSWIRVYDKKTAEEIAEAMTMAPKLRKALEYVVDVYMCSDEYEEIMRKEQMDTLISGLLERVR